MSQEQQQKIQSKVNVSSFKNSHGWKFQSSSSGILTTTQLDMLQDSLAIQKVPDIVFGFNKLLISNEKLKFAFLISPRDSLSFCSYKKRTESLITKEQNEIPLNHINIIPEKVQVKYHETWKNKKLPEDSAVKIQTIECTSDLFFQSPYKGTILTPYEYQIIEEEFKNYQEGKFHLSYEKWKSIEQVEINPAIRIEQTNERIPYANLTPSNPIKWVTQVSLYEDELGDSGLTQSECKFRVMDDCFFGLIRQYLRLDDMLVQILDTRFYHSFATNYIIREFTHKMSTYAELKDKTNLNSLPTQQNQSFIVQDLIGLKYEFIDKIILS